MPPQTRPIAPLAPIEKAAGAGFSDHYAIAAASPLIEIYPSGFGDGVVALGFALAWMRAAGQEGFMVMTAPDHVFGEYGAPNAEGLTQFGVYPRDLLIVRAPNQLQALWAAEQALTLPCAKVLCLIAANPKSLSLSASRRLFLTAEKSGARGVLLRFDALAPSAARSRWRVGAAASFNPFDPHSFGSRELGPPAFDVRLERNRVSPAGQSWRVDWNAHDHVFYERADFAANANDRTLDVPSPAAIIDGPGAALRRRAG